MAIYASQIKEKINSYLNLPRERRCVLEKTLLNLKDEESARRSFSEIVGDAPDVSDVLRTFLKTREGIPKFTGNIFYNYWIDERSIDKLNVLCACNPELRKIWENAIGEFEIPAKQGDVRLCCVPGCDYAEKGIRIPIARTNIFVPDEDLWDEEIIFPELTVVFPERGKMFRRLINYGRYWRVVNTCETHSSREDMQKYLDSLYLWKKESAKHVISDLIYDSSQPTNPPGVVIDEETYLLAENE